MAIGLDLKKLIWNENDFEQMGWHDNKIYALAFKDEDFEFVLDIDYILKWVQPEKNDTQFKFWVVPATLVFRNVWDLNINLESNVKLEIQDLFRENPHPPKNAKHIEESTEYDWRIETHSGEITFKSVGFKLYFRKSPVLLDSTKIRLKERGGISFETIP
jgi:hypothetical protein